MRRKSPSQPCPLEGDNKNCYNCAYYPDFGWSEEHLDCMRQDLLPPWKQYINTSTLSYKKGA